MQGNHILSLIIKPIPDLNIDNLIFGGKEMENEKVNDEYGDIRLKISETRQKIDWDINYKTNVFLGELVPIDFTFKCRKKWEIKDISFEIVDATNDLPDEISPVKSGVRTNIRKSTSMPVSNDFDDTQDPFEIAGRSSASEKKEFEMFYVKPTFEEFIFLPTEENQMDVFPTSNELNLIDFNDQQDVKFRLWIKFFNEGPKFFKIKIKYKIIKIYEDSKSEPISMRMRQELNLNCNPPFVINFDYQVKDWLTNGLNENQDDLGKDEYNFIKVPVNEHVPLSINVNSISERPMTIKNISLDVLDTRLISKIWQSPFSQIDQLEQDDSVWASFIIKPLEWENDSGQYADVVIEWLRVNENTGNVFRSICRIPTPTISIVSSPLCVDIRTTDSWFKLWEKFLLEIELK